jgi:hypothetical protein
MNCDKNATSFLSVGVLLRQKKANFGQRQNVLLIVRSQYWYQMIKKNIPSKQSAWQNIYFFLRPYFDQNKYVRHTNNLRPPEDEQRPTDCPP